MMTDPSLELHKVFIAALRASDAIKTLVGVTDPRVFDVVTPTAQKPYISLAQPQILPDRADCVDGSETSYQIDGWAAGPASVVIKQLGKAIAGALDGIEPVMTGHRMVLCEVGQVQYLNDPDGLTKHVAVTMRVVTEATD